MARRGALGGFSLDLFGGGSVDAGVFNIASQSKSNEAYLGLTRVETQWEAGQTSNAEYLAALAAYANTMKPDTSEYLNAQARVEATTYRIERNVMVAQVNSGAMSLSDLLNYDQSKLSGLNPDSQEYLDRLGHVTTTQNQLLNQEEREVAAAYGDGMMTTAQYQAWYKERKSDPRFWGNNELADAIDDRIKELDGRLVDEQDSQMVADYSAGRISPDAFLLYAGTARSRYAEGTTAAKDWDKRIDVAQDAMVEDDLNYRYSLSQDYARLQQFVASNKPPTGGTSTSTSKGTTSKRTVLGADGNWKVVTVTTGAGTKTTSYGPSKSEIAAWEKRKVEIESAKKQMAAIASKIGGLDGGFVDSTQMLGFYNKQLGGVAKGSSEWYAIQGKIDGINAQIAQEKVLAKQGLKITYPKGGSTTTAGGTITSDVTGGTGKAKAGSKSTGSGDLEDFMRAIAKIESGGRYEARNGTTGAYGKYQILPSNWSSYAQKAGLPANAKPTPENQEKVARAAFERYYDKYDGDWTRMAAAWHAGVAGTKGGAGTGNWGPKTSNYVNKVMSAMGTASPAPSSSGAPRPSGSVPSSAGGTARSGAAAPAKGGAASGGGKGAVELKVITGVKYPQPSNIEERRRYASELPAPKTTWATQSIPLGKGVEAATFDKVYAAVEKAFLKGSDEATITLPGGDKMVVFIGDDPAEKIGFMRDMDDSRMNLRDAEAVAYKGERSGAAKSASALVARKEAAGHELVALSFAGTTTRAGDPKNKPLGAADPRQTENDKPLAAGVRTLNGILAGVELHTRLMNEAWERNDITTAYLEGQYLEQLTQPTPIVINGKQVPVGDLNYLKNQINAANATVDRLTNKTGESVDTLLNGMGPGGTAFKDDMDRLDGAIAEITKAAEAGGKTQDEMKTMLAQTPDGKVIWLGNGQQAQVMLGPGFIVTVDSNGKTKKEQAKPGIGKNGKVGPTPPDKTVEVFLRTGSGGGFTSAFADYTVGRVGTVKIDGVDHPLMGKVVAINMDRDNNGVNDSTSMYFENPLNPGKWSTTPIVYNAPKGTKVQYSGQSDNPAFTFNYDQKTQVLLTLDPKTGTYVVNAATQGNGPMAPGPEMVPVGTADGSTTAKGYLEGFKRDVSGLSPEATFMSNSPIPAMGFTAREWGSLQVPGAAGSMKLGPAAPGPGYRPVGHDSEINKFTGFTITTEQQKAATAKLRAAEATSLVAYHEAERTSLAPLPAAMPGALGVNLNADLRAVDNAMVAGAKVLPPKPAPKPAATTAYKGIPYTAPAKPKTTTAPKTSTSTASKSTAGRPQPKVITPLPKPGVVGSGLKQL